MGAFENLPNTHVNIGFYTSEPPGPAMLVNYHQGRGYWYSKWLDVGWESMTPHIKGDVESMAPSITGGLESMTSPTHQIAMPFPW